MNTSVYTQPGFYKKYFLLNRIKEIKNISTFSDLLFYLDSCKQVMDTYDNSSMYLNYSKDGFINACKELEKIDKRINKIDSVEIQTLVKQATENVAQFASELV